MRRSDLVWAALAATSLILLAVACQLNQDEDANKVMAPVADYLWHQAGTGRLYTFDPETGRIGGKWALYDENCPECPLEADSTLGTKQDPPWTSPRPEPLLDSWESIFGSDYEQLIW